MAAARKLPKTDIITSGVLEKDPLRRLAICAGRLVVDQRPLLEFVFVVYSLGEANRRIMCQKLPNVAVFVLNFG
jgi:hypothetical protein